MRQAFQYIERQNLNLNETAEFVGVSRSSILRWEADGRFPRRRRLGPNRVAWIRQELEEWNQSREPVAPASDPQPQVASGGVR